MQMIPMKLEQGSVSRSIELQGVVSQRNQHIENAGVVFASSSKLSLATSSPSQLLLHKKGLICGVVRQKNKEAPSARLIEPFEP